MSRLSSNLLVISFSVNMFLPKEKPSKTFNSSKELINVESKKPQIGLELRITQDENLITGHCKSCSVMNSNIDQTF